MTISNVCRVGVNLGGWLSQYHAFDHQHFRTFITADDVKQIAGWGMDHVRLPIDYPILEDDTHPGVYKEEGFAHIDRCLDWCKAAGLNVILDLHQAPGYKFDALDRVALFSEEALQARFINLWRALAERYQNEGDYLYLELLNEIMLPNSDPWNALVARVVSAIRAIDPRRVIVLGGNRYNSPDQLKELQRPTDENILYTFHYYAPIIFTHQKAPWVPATLEYNTTIDYPGECPGHYASDSEHVGEVFTAMNRDKLGAYLQKWVHAYDSDEEMLEKAVGRARLAELERRSTRKEGFRP